MSNIFLVNIVRFLVLVILQVGLLNKIQFSGFINPYLYVYGILLLPFETPRWLLLVSSFLLGLAIDIFSLSIGLHAAASVLMAFARPGVIKIVATTKDFEQGLRPSIRDLGFRWFFSYSLLLVIIHHTALFYLEAFSFNDFFITFFRALTSVVFTMILIMVAQYLTFRTRS
jgi:rod shape-determining protein MreD